METTKKVVWPRKGGTEETEQAQPAELVTDFRTDTDDQPLIGISPLWVAGHCLTSPKHYQVPDCATPLKKRPRD